MKKIGWAVLGVFSISALGSFFTLLLLQIAVIFDGNDQFIFFTLVGIEGVLVCLSSYESKKHPHPAFGSLLDESSINAPFGMAVALAVYAGMKKELEEELEKEKFSGAKVKKNKNALKKPSRKYNPLAWVLAVPFWSFMTFQTCLILADRHILIK